MGLGFTVWLVVALLLHAASWKWFTYYRGEEGLRWAVWFAIWFWPPIVAAWIIMGILYYPITILLWPLNID